jgi:hypothetical protein
MSKQSFVSIYHVCFISNVNTPMWICESSILYKGDDLPMTICVLLMGDSIKHHIQFPLPCTSPSQS